jgi:hypothetical protein
LLYWVLTQGLILARYAYILPFEPLLWVFLSELFFQIGSLTFCLGCPCTAVLIPTLSM